MKHFFHKQLSIIEGFFSRIPGFAKEGDKHSLWFLNGAQFFGALNDNIYKLAVIFFLIQLEGAANANYILSAAGALFVIPFLLFSSMAGILADRWSKNRLIIGVKTTEIIVILFAIVSFSLKLKWGSYAMLFFLSMQSAFFGPSKYGIIPEIVPKAKVSKANGLITSFTYLAIIVGTFLASFLTEITGNNFVLVGFFCLGVAIAGFICSFGIQHTPPKGSDKKINVLFVRQIYHTLVDCRQYKHLLVAISGSAYFLFIGAFTQLNIIPFAIEALGYTEIAGGYLFLTTALGIALGAVLAGRASRKQIELGLACLAGLLISASFFTLGSAIHHPILSIIALFFLGLCGGNFIVPFDTFIQLVSPESNRGHVIAATNFLSFLGVLIASFAIYFFNELLGFNAATSFAVVGAITLLFTLFLIVRLSDLFLCYTGRKILHTFFPFKAPNLDLIEKSKNPILMFENASFFKAWLLCGLIPNLDLIFPQYRSRRFPWFEKFFYSLHRVDSPHKFEDLISHTTRFQSKDAIPCILLAKKTPIPQHNLFALFSRNNYEVLTLTLTKSGRTRTASLSKQMS